MIGIGARGILVADGDRKSRVERLLHEAADARQRLGASESKFGLQQPVRGGQRQVDGADAGADLTAATALSVSWIMKRSAQGVLANRSTARAKAYVPVRTSLSDICPLPQTEQVATMSAQSA